jgi:tRNA (adenine57-N1/adenine58-N1)-methyltransferase catalytic subunit
MDDIKSVLVSESGKHLYVRNIKQDYHCQYGMVKKTDLKIKSGSVKTNKGIELQVFTPQFTDLYRRIRRAPQIIPLKDLGVIVAETGIGKTSIVVDSGTGSGALALFLANIAKKVVSYELRKDFATIAEENIKFLKLKNLIVKNKDVYKGIDEKEVDVVTLDLPEPWKALAAANKALKTAGFVVSYSPTTPQVSDFVKAALKLGFLHVKTSETIQREWEFNERVVRPKSQPIGHSGFITVMRKIK